MLTSAQRVFFRDELRDARAAALLNAEGFEPIVVALERLGAVINPGGSGFGRHERALLQIARSGVRGHIDGGMPEAMSSLSSLFSNVRKGRNDAVHEGAHARHLVRHCVELALAIEEGLMAASDFVADFMVRSPVCAEPWQPIAFARQQMLVNSFSHLPVLWEDLWHVISDKAIARYLVERPRGAGPLRKSISDAANSGELVLEPAYCVFPETSVPDAVRGMVSDVALVISADNALLGIATSFDFL